VPVFYWGIWRCKILITQPILSVEIMDCRGTMFKFLDRYSQDMALGLIMWLCTLPLVALLIVPIYGPKAAGITSLVLLIAIMAICWILCGFKIVRR
jgi:hypothetical protein